MLNRGKVLVHSCNEQTMARFLPSRYKVLWALRVLRYKVYWEQDINAKNVTTAQAVAFFDLRLRQTQSEALAKEVVKA